MAKHIPWCDICAMGIQNLNFVVAIETHGLQVNMPDRFDCTVHQEHIPDDNFKALEVPGPNCHVLDPNVFYSSNKFCGHRGWC